MYVTAQTGIADAAIVTIVHPHAATSACGIVINLEHTTMRNLFARIVISSFVFGSALALADMPPLTSAQTAQMQAERDASKAKWASMTPAEKSAVTQSMRNKQVKDLNSMERMAQNDDMTAMSKSETTQMKAERQAAEAKYAKMTEAEKVALRTSAQQKHLAELSALERTSQNDDLGRYMSN